MKYIIIDNFNGNLNILSDNVGEPAIFTSAKLAQRYCDEEAQNGQVIPLDINILKLLSNPDDIEGFTEVIDDFNS